MRVVFVLSCGMVSLCLALAACGGDESTLGGQPANDGGKESAPAVADTGADAGVADAGADAVADTGVDAGPSEDEVELSAGAGHTCARLDDGTVKCWGYNTFGQLGLGDAQNRGDAPNQMGANLPTANLGPGRTALQFSGAYASHTCARLDNGTVKCWGWNFSGQLGLGDAQNRGDAPNQMGANLPTVDLGPGRTALQLSGSGGHTCARLDNGTVKCWGENGSGQLGLGDLQDRGNAPNQMGANLPTVDLGPGRTALQLSAGNAHTCARLDNGTVKCWGNNNYGQLGLGFFSQHRGTGPNQMGSNLPTLDLGPGRTALQISAGSQHTCARLDNGTVRCWGENRLGQLGLGDIRTRGDAPNQMGSNLPTVDLGPGRSAIQLVAGIEHTCARLDDGTVKCWGRNDSGELGVGDAKHRGDEPNEMGANLAMVNLGLGRTTLELSAGGGHTCARLDDGTVKCWGGNNRGQLGLGDAQNRGDQPNEMGENLPAVQLR
jgi:E3 ubiquitin-protein ligase HERC3